MCVRACIAVIKSFTSQEKCTISAAHSVPCVLHTAEVDFCCLAGEEDGNREPGESEMDGQGEKTRHSSAVPDEWDGPSKTPSLCLRSHRAAVRQFSVTQTMSCTATISSSHRIDISL